MKKFDFGQTLNTLANAGVVAGIIFLAVELNQNNELLELEARATLSENLQNGWDRISSDAQLAALFIKDRNDEDLSEVEELQLNAYWMGMLLRRQFQYQNFPESSEGLEGLTRLYTSYGSLRRAWNGSASASRSAGKDNFSPDFVNFLDEGIFIEP
jgi:hypothetical protein